VRQVSRAASSSNLLPAFRWTGFYIGGNLGGKWATTSGTVNQAPVGSRRHPQGLRVCARLDHVGHVHERRTLGYNWQVGSMVYGLEGDIDAQPWSTTRAVTANFPPGTLNYVPGDNFGVDSDWQASLRGRVGCAWDRVLLYATGGVAFSDARVRTNFVAVGVAPATAATASDTLVGGAVGGGLEYAISNNLTAGVEGRYTWYGSHTFNGGTVAYTAALFVPVTQTIRLNTAEVLFKLDYHFGGPPAPVVAKY
jgi:outer membrane immunogenic protein